MVLSSSDMRSDVHIDELYSENNSAAFRGGGGIYLFIPDPTTYLSSRPCY